MSEGVCRRCGAVLEAGRARYVMTLSFVADVDFELPEYKGEVRPEMNDLLEKIGRTPEEELMNQVYQKLIFVICTACKEEIAVNPLGLPSEKLT